MPPAARRRSARMRSRAASRRIRNSTPDLLPVAPAGARARPCPRRGSRPSSPGRRKVRSSLEPMSSGSGVSSSMPRTLMLRLRPSTGGLSGPMCDHTTKLHGHARLAAQGHVEELVDRTPRTCRGPSPRSGPRWRPRAAASASSDWDGGRRLITASEAARVAGSERIRRSSAQVSLPSVSPRITRSGLRRADRFERMLGMEGQHALDAALVEDGAIQLGDEVRRRGDEDPGHGGTSKMNGKCTIESDANEVALAGVPLALALDGRAPRPRLRARRTGVPRQHLHHRQPGNLAHRRWSRTATSSSSGRAAARTAAATVCSAQRFADGSPRGAEFRVNTYTTGHQRIPSVAVGRRRRFRRRLGQYAREDRPRHLQGQRFDAAGGPVGGEFQVNTYTTLDQSWPQIARGRRWAVRGGLATVGQDGGGCGARGPPLRRLRQRAWAAISS